MVPRTTKVIDPPGPSTGHEPTTLDLYSQYISWSENGSMTSLQTFENTEALILAQIVECHCCTSPYKPSPS